MKIQKILNYSVLLVRDDSGEESILLGKGIGFGHKAGDEIVRQPSDRVFIPLSNPDAQKMMELFASIPPEFIEITQEIVRDAETTLKTTLSPHIYLVLTDHLHFAVQRQQQGIVVTNRVFWEIKNFYRQEFQVGLRALVQMKERLSVDLPEEEAANIAFHIVNATKDTSSHYDAMKAAKLIGTIVNIVTYTMNCKLDRESVHYSRFINHLQFFAERYYSGKLLDSTDDFLYLQMQNAYPAAITCGERIRAYLERNEEIYLPNEEVAYLALHIARLMSDRQTSGEIQ